MTTHENRTSFQSVTEFFFYWHIILDIYVCLETSRFDVAIHSLKGKHTASGVGNLDTSGLENGESFLNLSLHRFASQQDRSSSNTRRLRRSTECKRK